ncbi:MAG: DUF4157 domain-containing protein [Chitinophagaceae bacterium]
MSYSSRTYRQRNPPQKEEAQKEGFFTKKHDPGKKDSKQGFFQPKLQVNSPGDSYEKEADAVANEVVNQPGSAKGVQRKNAGEEKEKKKAVQMKEEGIKEEDKKGIQRKEEPVKEEDEEKGIQRKQEPVKEEDKKKGIQRKEEPVKEEDKEKGIQRKEEPGMGKGKMITKNTVQKKSESESPAVSPTIAERITKAIGKGSPLPEKILHEMNKKFGRDFSDVRIHCDQEAAMLTKALQAQAFTHGRDIFFNTGKYKPNDPEGKLLLAHELTHVVQQTGYGNES